MTAKNKHVRDMSHTMYPSNIVLFQDGMREPLKPAKDNNKFKLDTITKGMFKGAKMFSLTLEERATCNPLCGQIKVCYGNNMPFAKRYVITGELMAAIDAQLDKLCRKGRVVVRLHVLGDFATLGYVMFWSRMLEKYPNLSIFGYTHWTSDTIQGDGVNRLNAKYPDRSFIKRSLDTVAGMDDYSTQGYSIVVKNWSDTPKGFIKCPQQRDSELHGKDATVGCANCGICEGTKLNVAFIEH